MLSSRFLVVCFLYISYATGLVAADPNQPFGGGNQFCQSVRTVTVTRTVAPGQPSPSSRPPSKGGNPPLPVTTTPPGKVDLGNGATDIKNSKTSSIKVNTKTSTTKVDTKTSTNKQNNKTSTTKLNTTTSTPKVNTKTDTKNVNTNTKNVNTNTKNVDTNTKNVNTNTKDVNTNTKNTNTKTSTINANPTSTSVSPPFASPPPVKASTGDPNTSLTLDPSVIQNINGKGQAAGETDSLVSPNDFINFCIGKTITNGQQVQAGSCNPTPMGDIPSVDNMPSAKFNSPKNFDTIAANTPFTISIQIVNLVTGTFTNAANTYYAAPQQLVGGKIQGHSHVTVQKMTSLDAPEPLDPKVFDFFKGLNGASPNGVLTADVTKGLPAGVYRISSINSAGNHQEALGPVAQRGSFNDVIYITVTDNGQAANSVSSSTIPPASSDVANPTATLSNVSSSSPAVPSPTDKGGKGGKNPKTDAALPDSTVVSSSTELPIPTGKGGKNGGKGDNVVTTSPALPQSTTPAVGNNKKNPVVSSSSSPPVPTSTNGGKGNGSGNGRNSKRMHKRSPHA